MGRSLRTKVVGFELQTSESNYSTRHKISTVNLIEIVHNAALSMNAPGAFSQCAMSLNAKGERVEVWSSEAVTRDALGWIYWHAQLKLGDYSEHHVLSNRAAELVNAVTLLLTQKSLVGISDDYGKHATIKTLIAVENWFKDQISRGKGYWEP